MISGKGETEAREMELSRSTVLHVALKVNDGDLEIDARKWFKFENMEHYIPSKGLQLKRKDWKRAIPLILELLESAEGKTANKEVPLR